MCVSPWALLPGAERCHPLCVTHPVHSLVDGPWVCFGVLATVNMGRRMALSVNLCSRGEGTGWLVSILLSSPASGNSRRRSPPAADRDACALEEHPAVPRVASPRLLCP